MSVAPKDSKPTEVSHDTTTSDEVPTPEYSGRHLGPAYAGLLHSLVHSVPVNLQRPGLVDLLASIEHGKLERLMDGKPLIVTVPRQALGVLHQFISDAAKEHRPIIIGEHAFTVKPHARPQGATQIHHPRVGTVDALKKALEDAAATGKRIAVLVPPDYLVDAPRAELEELCRLLKAHEEQGTVSVALAEELLIRLKGQLEHLQQQGH